MEIVKDINRWLLNPERKLLALVGGQSLRWRRVFELCLSKRERTRHIFANLDFRLPSPKWCVKLFHECRNGKVLVALLLGRFRCLEDFDGMLSERIPCRGIGRNMKKFLSCSCRGIGERICRIGVLAKSLSVARKLFVQCTLASPSNISTKVFWPKFTTELKSLTTIFSHNLLNLLRLQQFPKTLTGQ